MFMPEHRSRFICCILAFLLQEQNLCCYSIKLAVHFIKITFELMFFPCNKTLKNAVKVDSTGILISVDPVHYYFKDT